MRNTEEEKILNGVIGVNQAATDFYRKAANNSDAPAAERTFQRLRRIHIKIVDGLAIAAFRNGSSVPDYERGGGAQKTFDVFGAPAPLPVDELFIRAVEAVENRCAEVLDHAIASDHVSQEIKMHVFDAVALLGIGNQHVNSLKNMVSLQDNNAA